MPSDTAQRSARGRGLKDPALQLAELMNSQAAGSAAGADTAHIEKIASAVQTLLGLQARGRLSARLAAWPRVIDDAEDICQLAAIAFVEAYRRGRIAPDAERGEHSARSVAAYAWGICNRVFANTVRRSKPRASELLDTDLESKESSTSQYGDGLLDELLGGPADDDDSQLWDVLSSVERRCRPEDIIVTYLLASGVTIAEVRALLGVGVNTPANAVKRVGRELRTVIGMEAKE